VTLTLPLHCAPHGTAPLTAPCIAPEYYSAVYPIVVPSIAPHWGRPKMVLCSVLRSGTLHCAPAWYSAVHYVVAPSTVAYSDALHCAPWHSLECALR